MQFEFSSLLSPVALGIALLVLLFVFAALSVALLYHWREYGMQTQFIRRAPAVYFSVSGVCIALSIISYLALL
jgi:hypothetical protein